MEESRLTELWKPLGGVAIKQHSEDSGSMTAPNSTVAPLA
jgi:hypothetical protein